MQLKLIDSFSVLGSDGSFETLLVYQESDRVVTAKEAMHGTVAEVPGARSLKLSNGHFVRQIRDGYYIDPATGIEYTTEDPDET